MHFCMITFISRSLPLEKVGLNNERERYSCNLVIFQQYFTSLPCHHPTPLPVVTICSKKIFVPQFVIRLWVDSINEEVKILDEDVLHQHRVRDHYRWLPAHVCAVNFAVLLPHLLAVVKENTVHLLGNISDEPARPWAIDAHRRPVAELAVKKTV